MKDARGARILLNAASGVGPARARALEVALGGLEGVWDAGVGALSSAKGVGAAVAEEIVRARGKFSVEREEERAAGCGARIVVPGEKGWPVPLDMIFDPPLCLYIKGEWTPRDANALAVVGTRAASAYGRAQAERLSFLSAKAGLTVVSGLARGIDTSAHKGALRSGGRTIAVLGGALDKLYPPENRELADEIAVHGAVMSEFPMGREPARTTFVWRNRLVSGLSKGVLVVEAGTHSGAMQTASLALEQDRAVMAVPGRVDLEGSRGPHRLIRDGARLVEELDDILREFEFLFPPSERQRALQSVDARAQVALSGAEKAVLKALWNEGEADQDDVARRSGLPLPRLLTVLMQLEMKRIVHRLPGRRIALDEAVRQWRLEE
jgi:DNA processing protein